MSSSLGATTGTSIPTVVTALAGDNPGTFLDVRVTTHEDSSIAALRSRGWIGESTQDESAQRLTTLLAEATSLQLLVAADRGRLAAALELLAQHSIEPKILVLPASADDADITIDGYRHVLLDGHYDYYIAKSDVGLTANLAASLADSSDLAASLQRWRGSALSGWNVRSSHSDALRAQQELTDMKATVSWRVTRPLRAVRRRVPTGLNR
jgi:hypothetical protein